VSALSPAHAARASGASAPIERTCRFTVPVLRAVIASAPSGLSAALQATARSGAARAATKTGMPMRSATCSPLNPGCGGGGTSCT
jgi:hypothetical protein